MGTDTVQLKKGRLLLTGPVFVTIRSDPARFAEVAIDPELGVLC